MLGSNGMDSLLKSSMPGVRVSLLLCPIMADA
jgi:hypothetical protein